MNDQSHPTDEDVRDEDVRDEDGAAQDPQAQANEEAAGQPEPAPLSEAEKTEIAAAVEAILFATDAPISPAKIAQAAEIPSGRRVVRDAIDALNAFYEETGRAFRIERIAGGYQMLTLPEYNDVLGRLLTAKSESRLSNAALEALAVVAYRQPILRADIEAIRGVSCGEVLRSLMDKQLVKIVGRAEVIGRPMLYGTTRHFLEVFGLNRLEDLPRVEELRSGAEEQKPATSTKQEPAEQNAAAEGPTEKEQQAEDKTEPEEPSGEPTQAPSGQTE